MQDSCRNEVPDVCSICKALEGGDPPYHIYSSSK